MVVVEEMKQGRLRIHDEAIVGIIETLLNSIDSSFSDPDSLGLK